MGARYVIVIPRRADGTVPTSGVDMPVVRQYRCVRRGHQPRLTTPRLDRTEGRGMERQSRQRQRWRGMLRKLIIESLFCV